jgi:hypothetical protein
MKWSAQLTIFYVSPAQNVCIEYIPGKRSPLKPPFFRSSKVEKLATFPQLPSVGRASRVLPRFHPGFARLAQAVAVILLKGTVHLTPAAEAMLRRAGRTRIGSKDDNIVKLFCHVEYRVIEKGSKHK